MSYISVLIFKLRSFTNARIKVHVLFWRKKKKKKRKAWWESFKTDISRDYKIYKKKLSVTQSYIL